MLIYFHERIVLIKAAHGHRTIRFIFSVAMRTSASLLAMICARPLLPVLNSTYKLYGMMPTPSFPTTASGVCFAQQAVSDSLHVERCNRVYTSGGSWTTLCMMAKGWSNGRMSATLCCTNNCSMPLLQVTPLHNNRILIFCL